MGGMSSTQKNPETCRWRNTWEI